MAEQSAFFIKYLPMKISLVSMQTAVLPPFLGSTLRGALGWSLHRDIGAFNYFYHQRALGEDRQDIVNPYVIVPPAVNEDPYHEGEELCFEMLLIGEAADYCQPILNALRGTRRLGLGAARYPFSLVKVTHSENQRVIWQDDRFCEAAAQSVVLPYHCLPAVTQAALTIRTPLRIRRAGAPLEKIDFPTVMRNITRRIDALSERYGGWADKKEIDRIQMRSAEISVIRDCLEMKSLERYSGRLDEKMEFGGLMGQIRFEGDLTPFVPWLFAAQTLHIGRNTTFGMGCIEVEFL